MTRTRSSRLVAAVTICTFTVLGLAACDSSSDSDGDTRTSSTPTPTSDGPTAEQGSRTSEDAAELAAQVSSKFKQKVYEDSKTGSSLPYNIFLPDGYDSSNEYPLVLFIADSSLVGQDVKAPLSQYGALVWASDRDQQRQKSIVVVPEYPSVIIDDQESYTTSEYVELTARFIDDLEDRYEVNDNAIYGTGQSMGAMAILYLAAEHPDLFAAELLVSGQWDKEQLGGLTEQKFFYIAAGGDSRSTGGQKDLQELLDEAKVPYGTATFDATWSESRLDAAAQKLLDDGYNAHFATFKTGTVLSAAGQDAGGTGQDAGAAEHMASFEPAYKIPAVRDWLFAQVND
ncbi:alpha/beta hydrolase-fold protein [Aeromicrobium wangtongii]|uniref:carboxylesterase family protein n=1 Tax=Aeromicrobium wangtongii TaxID=2969247 RepID=UPI0020179D36|nr:alpha/beta hydrolase-fold protein [Aeromicrobium wangtongii]MCL3819947.1 alpha/beta hydrolase-fold protein [Aeromicrobium wangtongii]